MRGFNTEILVVVIHYDLSSFKDILCAREDQPLDRVISQLLRLTLLHYSTPTGNFYDSFQSWQTTFTNWKSI